MAASFAMHGNAARVVRALKYAGWTALAPTMGRAMAPRARGLAGNPTPCLVPVPLSAARRRERGFNQAELLARELGRSVRWPVRTLLGRSAGATGQARLGRSARRRRVRGAFFATPGAGPAGSGLSRRGDAASPSFATPLLLVDDVVTTGSTAAACRRVLQSAGWKCTGIVAFARTVHRFTAPGVGTGLASHE